MTALAAEVRFFETYRAKSAAEFATDDGEDVQSCPLISPSTPKANVNVVPIFSYYIRLH